MLSASVPAAGVARARSLAISSEREAVPPAHTAGRREVSRGDTSLRLTSPHPPPPHLPATLSIRTRVTVRPSRSVAEQPVARARVQPCLAPSSEL